MTCRLTRESARAAHACYDDASIAELVPPEGLSPLQVAGLPIPATDRFWALNRASGASERQQREQACRCARRALWREVALGREPDPRTWVALYAAERCARGLATDEDLRVALRVARLAAAFTYASDYAAASDVAAAATYAAASYTAAAVSDAYAEAYTSVSDAAAAAASAYAAYVAASTDAAAAAAVAAYAVSDAAYAVAAAAASDVAAAAAAAAAAADEERERQVSEYASALEET